MPDAHKAFLKLDANTFWKQGQTEQPQLHWLRHVILIQGQNKPIWPSMPDEREITLQMTANKCYNEDHAKVSMTKWNIQPEIQYIRANYWETESSSWWAEECINIKRQDHIQRAQSRLKPSFDVYWLTVSEEEVIMEHSERASEATSTLVHFHSKTF